MRNLLLLLLFIVFACKGDQNKIIDEFKEVPHDGWNWNDSRGFEFEITDTTWLYGIDCNLRITSSYKYSNIYLIYQLDGANLHAKNQFQIPLSDNTGKWLGKGMSNLISYSHNVIPAVKLRNGKYKIRFQQNMRDEKLEGLSDIGLIVRKVQKLY